MNEEKKPPSDNRFFILPFRFDVDRLKEDLSICEAEQWVAHYNTKDYQGDWNGIALRSSSGSTSDIRVESPDRFVDTPLLTRCAYFKDILSRFECPIETVRLLALSPGSIIKEHQDPGLGYAHGRFRLHIPITTDPDVIFNVDDHTLQMAEGHCWYADFSLPHSVRHEGTSRRIHLVIDGVRNDWTDSLFGTCGYDFTQEPKTGTYDETTKKEMIRHLRLMDTSTARALISTLESSLSPLDITASRDITLQGINFHDGWIPVALHHTEKGPQLKWQFIGSSHFTEPFFHETIRKTRHHPRNKIHPDVTTSLSELISMANSSPIHTPSAFIFHTSRCGSTLLSQLLACDELTQVLSEVPLMDAILRMPYQQNAIPQDLTDQAYVSVIRWIGQSSTAADHPLFIKTDSWHVFFYDTLRRLYPDTPFILMYRQPEEVIRSHQKQPGIQSIPNTLEPPLTGIPYRTDVLSDHQLYFHNLLLQIFRQLVRIGTQDPDCYLLNYHDGWERMITTVEKATGIMVSASVWEKMTARSQYHGKKTYEVYVEEDPAVPAMNPNSELDSLYAQLEEMKKRQSSRHKGR